MGKPYPKEIYPRECLGMVRMLEVLTDLNPAGKFSMLGNDILVIGLHSWEIECPEGYFITEENILTNKDELGTGVYDTFQLV